MGVLVAICEGPTPTDTPDNPPDARSSVMPPDAGLNPFDLGPAIAKYEKNQQAYYERMTRDARSFAKVTRDITGQGEPPRIEPVSDSLEFIRETMRKAALRDAAVDELRFYKRMLLRLMREEKYAAFTIGEWIYEIDDADLDVHVPKDGGPVSMVDRKSL